MKPLLTLLLLAPLTVSCMATSNALRGVSDRLDDFEEVLNDEEATTGELNAALANVRESVEGVAAAVKADAEEGWLTLESGAKGGILGLLTMGATNLFRDHRRRQRHEVTGTAPPAPPPAATG